MQRYFPARLAEKPWRFWDLAKTLGYEEESPPDGVQAPR